MTSFLDKCTAIVQLFKARNSKRKICKNLKVNQMLVWRTLKQYKETAGIQNQPGQGHP